MQSRHCLIATSNERSTTTRSPEAFDPNYLALSQLLLHPIVCKVGRKVGQLWGGSAETAQILRSTKGACVPGRAADTTMASRDRRLSCSIGPDQLMSVWPR